MANALTAILAAALTFSSAWQAMTRETSSRAATARGMAAYAQKSFARAADAFARSRAIRPGPAASFNLGTAQVAAGRTAEGAATLAAAMNDRSLRADASYNRGNAALESKQFDRAIADYRETLRLRPRDGSAKRNLEIALAQKQQQQQSQAGQSKNRSGSQPQQQGSQPKQQAGNRPENKPKGDANAEALLRAVQQQEQEELQRMKRARGDRQRVGW